MSTITDLLAADRVTCVVCNGTGRSANRIMTTLSRCARCGGTGTYPAVQDAPTFATRPVNTTCRYCGEPIPLFVDSAFYCCRECRDCAYNEMVMEAQR